MDFYFWSTGKEVDKNHFGPLSRAGLQMDRLIDTAQTRGFAAVVVQENKFEPPFGKPNHMKADVTLPEAGEAVGLGISHAAVFDKFSIRSESGNFGTARDEILAAGAGNPDFSLGLNLRVGNEFPGARTPFTQLTEKIEAVEVE